MFDNANNEFEKTIPGERLRCEIHQRIKNNNLSIEHGEIIFTNSAQNFYRLKNNPKISSDNDLLILLEELPEIFSLLDIIDHSLPVRKSILLISRSNAQEVVELFNSRGEEFSIIDWFYQGKCISIFIHIEQDITKTSESEHLTNYGNEIFQEIENRRIPVGYYSIYLKSLPTSAFSRVGIITIRAYGLREKTKLYTSGLRKDLGIGFRSSWEANFARILNKYNIQWEYEKTSYFLHSERFNGYYFPDFFLPNNLLVEIKGFWENSSRQKVLLFNSQYPNFDLRIIDSDLFFDLERKFKKEIPNWEDSKISIGETQIQVVGITRPERRSIVKSLKLNEELLLVRENENLYDRNAIKVMTLLNHQIGYVSKDWACIIAQKMDYGIEYSIRISEITREVIQVKIRRKNYEKEIFPKFLMNLFEK